MGSLNRKMSNQNHFTDTDFQPTKPTTTMRNDTEHTEQTEDTDPHDLEAIYTAANPYDESNEDAPQGTIDLELAQRFLEDRNSVSLEDYIEIDDDAAESLSKFQG